MEICFGSTKWEFSTRKQHFMLGKKSGKMTLPPQKYMPVAPLVSKPVATEIRLIGLRYSFLLTLKVNNNGTLDTTIVLQLNQLSI